MTLRTITTRFDAGRFDAGRLDSGGAMLYAGGTDIIPLARTGVLDVPDLVDIKRTELPSTIEYDGDGWTIGALATLSELEEHAGLRAAHPAVAEALGQVATRQIRNRATVGGNLLQRPRCSYFRDPNVSCWMKGGSQCPAIEGRNEHLALGGEHCVAPQPSDLAAVLVALDAAVEISSATDAGRTRRLPVADLLIAPRPDRRRLHDLDDGDVVTAIRLSEPDRVNRTTSRYLKAMDRAVWQFALVGLAVRVSVGSDGSVTDAHLCASGVANVPLDLVAAAASLHGAQLTAASIERAARVATEDLEALDENGYKISLLAGLVTRALEATSDELATS